MHWHFWCQHLPGLVLDRFPDLAAFIIGGIDAWPDVTLWNDGNDTVAWKREAYPGVDPQDWDGTWSFTPTKLPQPLLFFWGDCNLPSCVGPPRANLFFTDAWLGYLNASAGDLAVEVHTDHWIYVHNQTGTLPRVVATMKAWLAGQ